MNNGILELSQFAAALSSAPALLLVLGALTVLPGWALIVATGAWSEWDGLRRLCIAVGVSISLYPTLYYALRGLAPSAAFPVWLWWGLLAVSVVVIALHTPPLRARWHWPSYPTVGFGVIFALVLGSRLWIAVTHPYPAWSDSLHHAIATQLTADSGRLPTTLAPFVDVPLGMYHLGLYAIAGTAAAMTQAPGHLALQWTAQLLNAYTVLGVFLVLDRFVGRTAALAGMLTAGLLSHQPAFYVNWGRFTQLAAQVVLLIAWTLTVDTVFAWGRRHRRAREFVWRGAFAALTTAAVFLLHFRVAAFYALLLLPSFAWLGWHAWREGWRRRYVAAAVLIGGFTLLLVMPVLVEAFAQYLRMQSQLVALAKTAPDAIRDYEAGYFGTSLDAVPYVAAHIWLLAAAAVAALIGLLRRNPITWLALGWGLLLVGVGNLYQLGIPYLNFTNLGAVLVMAYLPISLVMGAAVHELLALTPAPARRRASQALLLLFLLAALPFAWLRARDIEEFRFFLTDADVRAMQWISQNTPQDAKFVVNTSLWFGSSPHGTDGGYWIPYFTQRATNAGVMLSSITGNDHTIDVITSSRLVKQVERDPALLAQLGERGYTHIYVGAAGSTDGPGLDVTALAESGNAEIIYQRDGVTILRLLATPAPP